MQTRGFNVLLTVASRAMTVTGSGCPDIFIQERCLLHTLLRCRFVDADILCKCKRYSADSERQTCY